MLATSARSTKKRKITAASGYRGGDRKEMLRKDSWLARNIGGNVGEEPMKDCCSWILMMLSYSIFALTLPLSLVFCLRIIKEYERAVLFRLGRLIPGGCRGPGIIFVMPCVDVMRKVDLRVISFDVPPQEILSRDSVTVSVDAVIYFRVSNPIISVTNVNDPFLSTKLLAQTTLRNILGTKTLSEMLSERDQISEMTEKALDEGTDPWGVKVERVEVKDIRLPDQLMRAMAAEAEAAREAKAKVIAAEGEHKSSRALREAAEVLSQNPVSVQLRYLQTLVGIASENNHTVIMPLPVDAIRELISRHFGPNHGSPSTVSPAVTSGSSYETAHSHTSGMD